MDNGLKKYHQLVDLFIKTDEFGTGDESKRIITLFDIENKSDVIQRLKKDIEKITKKYNLVVLDKNEPYTNINILDIEI